MGKLEEKLKELGYTRKYEPFFEDEDDPYVKDIGEVAIIYQNDELFICEPFRIETQEQIDNLQQAFNEMQKDLEVLKEYEN